MAASLSTFRQTRRGRTHQTQLYNFTRKNFASLRNFFLSFVIFFFKRNEPTNPREEKDKNNQPGKSRRGILNLNKNKNKFISIRDVFWGNHNNNKKNIYFYRLFFFTCSTVKMSIQAFRWNYYIGQPLARILWAFLFSGSL